MKKLAVITSKGGTGKTTTAVNLAHGLALRGQKVLLIDCDSQASVSTCFQLDGAGGSLGELVLSGKVGLIEIRPNLFTIPSGGMRLAEAERHIANKVGREFILRNALAGLQNCDYVICDCSPSTSLINVNALTFVDGVILPVSMDFLAFEGARQTLRLIQDVRTFARTEVSLMGILATQFDARTRVSREILELLRAHFPENLFRTVIRVSTRLREAPHFGKTVFEYAPQSTGAEDYASLTGEVLGG